MTAELPTNQALPYSRPALRFGQRISSVRDVYNRRMTNERPKYYWLAAVALLVIQAALALTMVHRESLTFDEGDHMFAGYMMWKAADYGLNPEHPPLAKLLATVPLLSDHLWVPPPMHGQFFKAEAYLNGRDWLARNDGDRQHLVFEMRASAELLALGLCLFVFLAAREWFGNAAGLVALALVVFDPNVLAHSALVTPPHPTTSSPRQRWVTPPQQQGTNRRPRQHGRQLSRSLSV